MSTTVSSIDEVELGQPGEGPSEPSDAPRGRERRVRTRTWDRTDVFEAGGSAVSALAMTWLLFARLTHLEGGLGFVLVWFALFLAVYGLVSYESRGRVAALDRMATAVITGAAMLALAPLFFIIGYIVTKGASNLRPQFFTETMELVDGLAPPTAGGALHAIVGSMEQVGLAFAISVPLAVLTAVHLNEIKGRLARPVRVMVDAMSGVPSIVAGLFVYTFWVSQTHHTQSGFAAAVALSVLMLPTVARTAVEMLRLVPDGLREAALALGAPEWRVALRVVVPTARTGLITAALLGTARVLGETAPVLLTAFGAKTLQVDPLGGPQSSLPLYVYDNVLAPRLNLVDRAWTGAFVLMVLVLILFTLARFLVGRSSTGRLRRLVRRA